MYFTINKVKPSTEKDGYPSPKVIDFDGLPLFINNFDKK